ncbi:MAG: SAM-dependent methyltransferase [Legionella sp.]|nr:SAM-dependent methyltransferase [Legionella sp.]
MDLIEYLKNKINKKGHLSFPEFMQIALYAPQGGYYSSSIRGLGAEGDFTTAPEMTSLFGSAMAKQVAQVLGAVTQPTILELGAGSGRLCIDILRQLEREGCLPQSYLILEVSAQLREQQYDRIAAEIPQLGARVKWLKEWPKEHFNGVIVANEVLDAMPVHRFLKTTEGILESYIRLNDKDVLEEYFLPSENLRLISHLEGILPEAPLPYLSEANLWIDGWIKECYATLAKGAVFLLDYGFPQHEYYHPDRYMGTLMCHYQHRAHTDPLLYIGQQDITAHVDFTHVATAADLAGFHIAGYTHQAAFLLGCDLLTLFNDIQDPSARFREQAAVKQLLQSSEMGELFKVMALTKELNEPLRGFQFYDKRASL